MNLGKIRAAHIETSPRLQRLMRYLKTQADWVSTWELVHNVNLCAVNTAISELRANNIDVECRKVRNGVYQYRLAEKAA